MRSLSGTFPAGHLSGRPDACSIVSPPIGVKCTEVGSRMPQEQRPKKLLDQMRDVLRTQHYAIRTEHAYVDWARRFILFHQKRHPTEMGTGGNRSVSDPLGRGAPCGGVHAKSGPERSALSLQGRPAPGGGVGGCGPRAEAQTPAHSPDQNRSPAGAAMPWWACRK